MELNKLRDFAQARKFDQFRTNAWADLRDKFTKHNLNFSQRSARIFEYMCQAESPLVLSDEKISFSRSKRNIPFYFETKDIKKEFRPKQGEVFDVIHNITPNYNIVLDLGLQNRLDFCKEKLKTTLTQEQRSFYKDVMVCINAILELTERYAVASIEAGNHETAAILRRVPKFPATSFREALQSLRIVSAAFYLCDNYQIGFGRTDQYLWRFYKTDIDKGVLTREEAFNLLKEFFISLNKDTDLYRGVQQGDNGQSMMLGGCTREGKNGINDLTYLILEVSKDLKLIDPKINLRIDSNTPVELLKLGCELTRVGLGFPQYSNDEVVIPALVKKGYALEDARDYTVAACWEFIIPGSGLDVVNQGAVSFPAAVDQSFDKLVKKNTFDLNHFNKLIAENIKSQAKNILDKRSVKLLPSPFMSIFMNDALEKGADITKCAKYRNVGIHGAGISNAVDAYCVILDAYDTKGIGGLKELYKAKCCNFMNFEELRKELVNSHQKCGNNEEKSNIVIKRLFDYFADAAEALSTKDCRIRPGSGSAQFYIWLVNKPNDSVIESQVKATADGRLENSPFASSLAPSPDVKINGLISVLKSFSNIDYSRIMNGGPITVEFSPSVFKSEDGITKLANVIQFFVKLGNQQLQLNLLDVAQLEDAVLHPELHRNLIVRVWGWSGYFCELASEYQQQIINRHRYEL